MTARPDSAPPRPRRRGLMILAAAALASAGIAGVYGIAASKRNPAAAACRPAAELATRLAPLVRGEVAALAMAREPRPVPALTFHDEAGREVSLADWRGRTVLLNLWATWCVPCRKEMPALDELQAKLGSQKFEVVAVNIDTRDPEKPKAWLRDNGVQRLGYYADSSARVFQDLKAVGRAFGMPTTLLVDPQGCEIGYLAGPAEWASDDALKLIGAALGGRAS